QDPDFIESALFGDIAVNVQGSTTADATQVSPVAIRIDVTPAAGKSVVYANVARSSATPPVYALSYTQTAYVDEITNFTAIDATTIADIDADTDFTFSATASNGFLAEYINITASNVVYPIADLGDRGNFIARNFTETEGFTGNNADLTNDDGKSIIINVNSGTDLSEGVEIFKADPTTGNLERADSEFDAYFNLAVNNTAAGANKHITITQKVFTNTLADEARTVVNYNALDTIQLYEGGTTTEYTFNYFIRARATTDGTTNASNYALAQFSVVVEATGLNIGTEVLQVALVPDGGNINHTSKIVLFDAENGNGAAINLNQIAVNSFDAYDLIVEFVNSDAALNNETASAITITLPQGNTPDSDAKSNVARDGGLIDLRMSSASREPAAATLTRTITDESLVVTGPGTTATFLESEQTYTRSYDFALAQNLYGTANIIISVQDNDAKRNLGRPSMQVISLSVNGPSGGIDEENQVFTASAITETGALALDALQEDTGPLSSSGSIPVVLSVTAGFNQGDLQGQTESTHSLQGFTKANDPAVADNASQNGLDKDFITDVSSDAFTYLQHGWGVQAIKAEFSINEPRGFSGSGSDITREYSQSFPVIVANTVDATSASDIQLSGFSSSNFGTLGNLATATNTGSGTVTFADNDLLFDTITGALGAGVTATGVAPTGLPALTFATNPSLLTRVSGSENLARSTLNYGLTLTTSQLDSLLANPGTTNFPLNLAFNDGGAGTAITSGLGVEFALDTEDPTVPADAIPDTTVAEESAGAVAGGVLGTLTFTDGDIVRAGVANYTLSVSVVRQGTSDSVDGLLAWSALATTSTAGQATADLIYSKALDDAEVGVYTVTWALMDSTAADSGQSFFTGQEFTLTVNRLDDLATDGAITFADTGSDLIINTNTNRGKTFPISLAFTDRDFLEPVPPLR
ncbi:MAG: hypothetical protein K0U41_00130, partial [Gammaproteobacteria bacterium]|nr:hypothetical protein [Gammaproteobacteria bacterium]